MSRAASTLTFATNGVAFGWRLLSAGAKTFAYHRGDGPTANTDWIVEALTGPQTAVANIETLGSTSGTTDRTTFRISFADEHADALRVFAKTSPKRWVPRLFGRLLSLGANEVRFYRQIAPDAPVLVPKCYAHTHDERSGEFGLLLEDLVPNGARFASIGDEVTEQMVEAVIDSLASLHAVFWRSPRLNRDLNWLGDGAPHNGSRVSRFISELSHRPTLRQFPDVLGPEVSRDAVLIHRHRETLDRYWARQPQTVIHGDSHVGNMYFVDGRAGLLDWQVVQSGQGIRDVAYFLITSVDTDLRLRHQRPWITRYLDQLRALGVPESDLNWDATWNRYRTHALYAYVATAVTAAMSDLQSPQIQRLGLERAQRALLDLEAFEALNAVVALGR